MVTLLGIQRKVDTQYSTYYDVIFQAGVNFLYSQTTKLFFSLLPYVAIAIFGEIAIQIIKEKLSAGAGLAFASILVWSYLAYAAHAAILVSEDRDPALEGKRVLGFALRTFALILLIMIPAAIISFIIGGPALQFVTTMLFAALVFSFLVFILFGTVLPAYVINRNVGFTAAFSRGKSQFGWLAGHLLIGPVLVSFIAFAVIFSGMNLTGFELLSESYFPNIPLFVVLIVGYTIRAFGAVMVAWILSTAYLRSEA